MAPDRQDSDYGNENSRDQNRMDALDRWEEKNRNSGDKDDDEDWMRIARSD